MEHQELYDKALEAVKDLYSDKHVSRHLIKEDLIALKNEINKLIESL